jgi:hypothetical protein
MKDKTINELKFGTKARQAEVKKVKKMLSHNCYVDPVEFGRNLKKGKASRWYTVTTIKAKTCTDAYLCKQV